MISTDMLFLPARSPARSTNSRNVLEGTRLLLTFICLFSLISPSEAGLKIYYLRHAEAGHNVVKEWEKVPRAQRPVYVGNANTFTPKGETQVAAATEKLRKYHFDFIAVSPLWRTRHTILPYLQMTGAKAEIWPELHEFSFALMPFSSDLPVPSATILNAGPPVQLPSDETNSFSLRADAKNEFKLPGETQAQREAAARLVLQHLIEVLQQRFHGSDRSVLLVGHGNSGLALLRMLTNDKLPKIPPIANTGVWMVEEQPDGRFKLEIYNDAPYQTN